MKNFIYCYTNNITNRKYVGQTNDLNRRQREHRSNSMNPSSAEYDLLFHRKLRQYGEDNFTFSVLEEMEDKSADYVNSREIYWIAEMHSYVGDNGYNMTLGGDNHEHSKIYSIETIQKAKSMIREGKKYSEITEELGISSGYLSELNNGNLYRDEGVEYPLKKNYQTEDDLLEIYELLEFTDIPMTEIAKQKGKGYSTIKKINAGTLWHDDTRDYPVRKKNSTIQKADQVKQMLLNGANDAKIMQYIGVSPETIRRINKGETHYDSSLTYPLRKPVSTI